MPTKKIKNLTEQDYLKYYYDVPYEGSTSAGKPLRKLKNIICPYRGIEIIPSHFSLVNLLTPLSSPPITKQSLPFKLAL